jgi:lipopolysaccharide export system permease protein
MFKLLDRQLFYSYIKAYLICLSSLLSLYVVVDLFTNIEDFTQNHTRLVEVLTHIGIFYGYKVTQIFDRLSEAIALLAAMFTVAWIQKNNELLPLLSAGVSTQRVVRPVLFSACAMLSLTVANQELIIPRIGVTLFADRDDPKGEKEVFCPWGYDRNGIHLEARVVSRRTGVAHHFCCTIPETMGNGLLHLTAAEARYIPRVAGEKRSGGWLMTDTVPAEMEKDRKLSILDPIDPGKYFLRTDEIDYETFTRGRNWFLLASTWHLYREMCKPDSMRLPAMAVLFHMRLTRPIMGLLLVFLGLSVILRDQNRNVFISAAQCLMMCALFFGATFACKHFGDHEILSPALAAWLPVLFFGPLAFVLFDAVHT